MAGMAGMIGIGMGLYARRHSGAGGVSPPPPPPPPVTPLTAVAADGWRATWPSPPATVTPMATTLSVTRQGFDATGAAAFPVDAVGVLSRVRLPHPDHAILTADQVSLSEFIYAGDTISGMTNGSTRAYPRPIAIWLNHDLERATAATHTLRLAVAHAHARNGRPVAAVRFTVSDGVTTVEQVVSAMTAITYASGLSVPHFAATIDLSGLMPGAFLVVDAVIYPWVGEAFTLSVDADTYPSPNLTTLRLLNDHTGSYGTGYAYVDPVSGNNATGLASASPATAAASPFLTIAGAAAAIRTFNNANHGRDNAGGGVIRLAEGVHNSSPFRTASGTTAFPLVIEAADPAAAATTVYLGHTASTNTSIPNHTEFRNITLRKQGGSVVFLDSNAGGNALLVFRGCLFDQNGTSSYSGWVYRVGRVVLSECSGAGMVANAFSTAYKAVTAIGCPSAGLGDATYHAVACRGARFFALGPATGRPAATGSFCGWNVISRNATGAAYNASSAVGPRGIAVVGNVLEGYGGFTDAVMWVHADSNTQPIENAVVQMNTCIGERVNLLYLDAGTNVDKSGCFAFNVFEQMNIKSDLFSTNGANTGNWPARYKVGWPGNMAYRGANNSQWYGPVGWIGEIPGDGEAATGSAPWPDLAWADDQSNRGGGAGGGDYTPGAGSAVPRLPAGRAPYGTDLKGRVLRNDGTGFIGAEQGA